MSKPCFICEGSKVFDNEPCFNCKGIGVETEDTSTPICPHCGYEDEDAPYDLQFPSGWTDGAETKMKCSSCGKDSEVTLHISYTFTTSKEDEEEEAN